MSSLFTIVELTEASQGDGTYTFVDSGVRFEWDSARQSSPREGWPYGVKVRTRREDYVGADLPTEQVLGVNFKPFTLKGAWLDKYNFGGFAEQTRVAFEQMTMRANLVRVTYDQQTFVGLITDLDLVYRTPWRCEYAFTVSPHYRNAGGDARGQKTIVGGLGATDPQSYADQAAALALQARQTHQGAPVLFMLGGLYTGVGASVDALAQRTNTIQAILNTRVLTTAPATDTVNSFSRVVQAFNGLVSDSRAILDQLGSTPTSTGLAFESALTVLEFEEWARELGNDARKMIVLATAAAADLATRVTPSTLALYKPYAGESLYAISTRFYGTPTRWRDIFDANNLTSFTLSGLELLTVPAQR